ncbi:MarR family winged helix-turn-helix transcriptional regulator [Frankia sp. QA3]|uniref:MarR family winged helix-turn-helix transcriptional regulator n=1 Tax=Frankia sp. QA3 TaxID=710111 RepID=UPI000269C781|nr:MarR family winged helix-turn-helix transcriptional regulator [Frankia sp. QA3]EIV94088.1 transcriptional regulator [Frankia sp. QA3]
MSDAAAPAEREAEADVLPDDLGQDLGWLLGQVQYGYLAASAAAVGELPGGLRALHVLGAAVGGEARNQIEVARRFGIDRTVMVRIVDDLERAGLVERHPDPADRRARIITATAQGARLYAATQEDRRLVDQHVLAGLEPAERERFVELLRRIAARLLAVDPTHGAAACDAARREIEAHDATGCPPGDDYAAGGDRAERAGAAG